MRCPAEGSLLGLAAWAPARQAAPTAFPARLPYVGLGGKEEQVSADSCFGWKQLTLQLVELQIVFGCFDVDHMRKQCEVWHKEL